jgi:hypothetical protein
MEACEVLDDSFLFHLDMIYRSFEEHRSPDVIGLLLLIPVFLVSISYFLADECDATWQKDLGVVVMKFEWSPWWNRVSSLVKFVNTSGVNCLVLDINDFDVLKHATFL